MQKKIYEELEMNKPLLYGWQYYVGYATMHWRDFLFTSICVSQIETRKKAYMGFTLSLMLKFLKTFFLII